MTMIFINLFRCRNYSNTSDSLVQCLLALVTVGTPWLKCVENNLPVNHISDAA